jgi:hypothetical protein
MAGTRVCYKDAPNVALTVRLIHTWHRGDIDHAIMSVSSGPKEYVKNIVHALFENSPALDAVSMVRASGPPFFLLRVGRRFYSMDKREVEATGGRLND